MRATITLAGMALLTSPAIAAHRPARSGARRDCGNAGACEPASPLPPPPAELHATDLTFTVPIDYSLN